LNSILFWNGVALDANKESHSNGNRENTGPTLSARALALVHLAMHDAYFGINTPTTFTPYTSGLPGVPSPGAGASADAAVASAAYFMLTKLFPSQKAAFDAKLAAAPMSGGDASKGHMFGVAIANFINNLRKDDPGAGDAGYSPSAARGAHRPDPDNPQGFHAPYYGDSAKLFSSNAFTLAPPPMPGSADYATALEQVRRLGIKHGWQETAGSAARTPEQTVIGVYWGYDGANGLGTPPRLYNQIVLKVMEAQGTTDPVDQLRLLTMANVAMADAGILAWKEKYRYDLWRPVVGIREHDSGMGPLGSVQAGPMAADCDPAWLPMGAPASNSSKKNFTPDFPAYPSGHATFGAASLQVVRLWYGIGSKNPDMLLTSFVSDEYDGKTRDNAGTARPRYVRHFPKGLWDMIRENGESRVYLGVHWIFDAFAEGDQDKYDKQIGGVPLGLWIAESIFNKKMTRA